jgi:hypothetical protein
VVVLSLTRGSGSLQGRNPHQPRPAAGAVQQHASAAGSIHVRLVIPMLALSIPIVL